MNVKHFRGVVKNKELFLAIPKEMKTTFGKQGITDMKLPWIAIGGQKYKYTYTMWY